MADISNSFQFLLFILIIANGNVVAYLPITIYGLGTREIKMIRLFSIFNVMSEKIVSISLFWIAITWLFPSLLAAAVKVSEGKWFVIRKVIQWLSQ